METAIIYWETTFDNNYCEFLLEEIEELMNEPDRCDWDATHYMSISHWGMHVL